MPNRILRDCTDSESVDKLSEGAEVLFYRLIMRADDFGFFHANPKLIKGACFPLKNISEVEIQERLIECFLSGLISIYEVDKKKYLQIKNFGQRMRIMKSKFPKPPSDDGQTTVISQTYDGLKGSEVKGNEIEIEIEIIKKEFNNSGVWKEKICMDLKIKPEQNEKLMGDFLIEIGLKGTAYGKSSTVENIKEAKSHYISWLKKKIEALKKENPETPKVVKSGKTIL